eukprot:3683371-Amphidinium_carterae.1
MYRQYPGGLHWLSSGGDDTCDSGVCMMPCLVICCCRERVVMGRNMFIGVAWLILDVVCICGPYAWIDLCRSCVFAQYHGADYMSFHLDCGALYVDMGVWRHGVHDILNWISAYRCSLHHDQRLVQALCHGVVHFDRRSDCRVDTAGTLDLAGGHDSGAADCPLDIASHHWSLPHWCFRNFIVSLITRMPPVAGLLFYFVPGWFITCGLCTAPCHGICITRLVLLCLWCSVHNCGVAVYAMSMSSANGDASDGASDGYSSSYSGYSYSYSRCSPSRARDGGVSHPYEFEADYSDVEHPISDCASGNGDVESADVDRSQHVEAEDVVPPPDGVGNADNGAAVAPIQIDAELIKRMMTITSKSSTFFMLPVVNTTAGSAAATEVTATEVTAATPTPATVCDADRTIPLRGVFVAKAATPVEEQTGRSSSAVANDEPPAAATAPAAEGHASMARRQPSTDEEWSRHDQCAAGAASAAATACASDQSTASFYQHTPTATTSSCGRQGEEEQPRVRAATKVYAHPRLHPDSGAVDDNLCQIIDLTPARGAEAQHQQLQIAEFELRSSMISTRSQTSAWTRFGLLERLDHRVKRRRVDEAPWHSTQQTEQDEEYGRGPAQERVPWRPGVAPPPPPVRATVAVPPPPPPPAPMLGCVAPPVTPKTTAARTPFVGKRPLIPQPPAPAGRMAKSESTPIRMEGDSPSVMSPICWSPAAASATTPPPPMSVPKMDGAGFRRVPEPPTPKNVPHMCMPPSGHVSLLLGMYVIWNLVKGVCASALVPHVCIRSCCHACPFHDLALAFLATIRSPCSARVLAHGAVRTSSWY